MEIVVQIFQDLTQQEKIEATVIFAKTLHKATKPFCLMGNNSFIQFLNPVKTWPGILRGRQCKHPPRLFAEAEH